MEPLTPEQRVDQIMAAIRHEIKKRREGEPAASPQERLGVPLPTPIQLPRLSIPLDSPDSAKRQFHVNDFLGVDHQRFLDQALGIILREEPDPEMRSFFAERLRSGAMTEIEVLGHLRSSPEGRKKGVEIRGLHLRFLFARVTRRVPFFGYLLRWAVDLVRLPSRIAGLRQEKALLRCRLAEIERGVDEITSAIELGLRRVTEAIHAANLPSLAQEIEVLRVSKAEVETVDYLIREVAGVHHLSAKLSSLEPRIPTAFEKSTSLAALYPSLAMTFRGTREVIKSRQTRYLEYVRACTLNADVYPALDLGCGRGEWLEILREAGISGQGVENNTRMVEQCRKLRLEVVEADVLDYLRELKPESLGFITAFHVVEHLEHEKLLALLAQSQRVLRSGGLLLIETPNPANLLVGSWKFHLDPTHRKPLPADLLRFLVQAHGFTHLEVLYFNPDESGQHLEGEGVVTERLNQILYGPQDYAVLGYKP